MLSSSVPSMSSALVGRREPRIATKPLRDLTPDTSKGFEVIEFAKDFLHEPLLPWQEEAVIRSLELREDGSFRFRTVLILVARQNGKTHLVRVLALWRLFVDGADLVLSAAQSLDIAREAWQAGVNTAKGTPCLAMDVEKVRYANGEQELALTSGGRWKIAASSRQAGRGLSVDTLFLDELREQRNFDAWSALSKTTQARRNGQIVAITNAGDDESVVLNHLRAQAMAEEDDSICILEWSGEDGCDLDDWDAIAQANPGLGHIIPVQAIRSSLTTDPAPVFRTEVLCQKVDTLDSAIPMDAWNACADPNGNMESLKSRVVACLDIAPDGEHASLVVAAEKDDGRIRVEIVREWRSTKALRADLPDLLDRVKPRSFAWFPGGPAAAMAADFRKIRNAVEVKAADIASVCQGFTEQVVSRRIVHGNEGLLNAQVAGTARLNTGDGYRFSRKGGAHCDAVYAAAGAVHLVRTSPSVGKPRLVLPSST